MRHPKTPKDRLRIYKNMASDPPPPQPTRLRIGHFLAISKRYNIPPPPLQNDVFVKSTKN